MNKKTITPNPQQPVDRIPTGQLPNPLQELSEDALSRSDVLSSDRPSNIHCLPCICCSDGDDE